MKSKGEGRLTPGLRLAASIAVAILFGAAVARAADAGDDPPAATAKKAHKHKAAAVPAAPAAPLGPSAASRLEQLGGELSNLKSAQTEASNEVKKIEQAITVAPPASASAAPQTIGEHVSVLESQLGDVRKNLSDNLGVHIHGLVDAAYQYNVNQPNTTFGLKGGPNPGDLGGRVNQLRVFDQDANGFQLSQFNLHVDRTVEGGVGFVTDLNFGKTAEVVRASTRWSNTIPNSSDVMDVTQAYATYTVPLGKGINLSAGKFVTLLGEEVIPVYNNFDYNESKSLLFGFAIPFTHTGVRAQYSFTDRVGLTVGINNGWDDASDNNNGKSLEGQLALTPSDNLSLLINGMYGPEQVNIGSSKRGIIDPVVTWKTPLAGLTAVGEYLWAHESGPVSTAPAFSSQGNALFFAPVGPFPATVTVPHGVDWQGFAGYLVYDLSDKIELATRGEVFRDSDGVRTGLRQTLGEITETLNYKVAPGLLARLEYRHDESNAKPFFGNSSNPAPPPFSFPFFVGAPFHTFAGQDTFGAAAIYAF